MVCGGRTKLDGSREGRGRVAGSDRDSDSLIRGRLIRGRTELEALKHGVQVK